MTGFEALNWLESGFYPVSPSNGHPSSVTRKCSSIFLQIFFAQNLRANSLAKSLKKHINLYPDMPSLQQNSLYYSTNCPVQIFHHFFCCSSTTKVTIVCGHNLTKLGVHPRNINLIPSFLSASCKIDTAPPVGFSFEFIILVLNTSMGEHLL